MANLDTDHLVWLIDDEFDSHDIEREILEKKGFQLIVSRGSEYKTDYSKSAERAKGILVWIGHFLGAEDIKGFNACKIIGVRGGGYNNVDVDAATKQNIAVTYVPGYCVEEVSDHTLAFILYFNRWLQECRDMTRKGRWRADKLTPTRRLSTQLLGLIGFGKIAKSVARKAKCLGLNVWAYDPYEDDQEMEKLDVKRAGLGDLVKSADFISLHIPLTPDTRYMFNSDIFDLMKPTSFLINTCRGEVVDETALMDALEAKKIAGAALDVLEEEPPDPQKPLLSMPNVIISPHSAYLSQEALTEVLVRSTQSVVDVLEGRVPDGIINPVIFHTHKKGKEEKT